MFPLDSILFENGTGTRLLFTKNSQQQVTGSHEVVFQRIPFVCGMLENTPSRFCEGISTDVGRVRREAVQRAPT
jgi:hypothetical protein